MQASRYLCVWTHLYSALMAIAFAGCGSDHSATPNITTNAGVASSKPLLLVTVEKARIQSGLSVDRGPDHRVVDGIGLIDLLASAYGVAVCDVRGIPREKNIRLRVEMVGDDADAFKPEFLSAALASALGISIEVVQELGSVYVLRDIEDSRRSAESPAGVTSGVWEGTRWRGKNVTVKEVAAVLSMRLEATVVDKSALSGKYDFELSFTKSGKYIDDSELASALKSAGLSISREQSEYEVLRVHW